MKESEIRPQAIFEKYLEISAQDALAMQADSAEFPATDCPACASSHKEEIFQKNGFHIQSCLECFSIFCSPRPSQEQLKFLYAKSPSSHFWAKEFFPQVAEVRREKLFRPKAKLIFEKFQKLGFNPRTICDVGAGHGFMLEEMHAFWPSSSLYAIEPGGEMAGICRRKGFQVLEKTVEEANEWANSADLVTSFEVIEHVYEPKSMIEAIYNLVKPLGYCLVTGLGGDGFDIQVLGKESKSVFPPHHLNFMSIKGLDILFRRAGFKEVEITTPGKLDVDIIQNSLNSMHEDLPLFVRTILARDEATRQDFQKFLADHQLSSHVWVLAKK
jgi:SAM-dependent methyltransferase